MSHTFSFTCWPTAVFWGKKWLFRFSAIFNWTVWDFFFFSVELSLYVSDTRPSPDMWSADTISFPIQEVAFSFCWTFLLCRCFLVGYSPTYLFGLCCLYFGIKFKNSLVGPMSRNLFCCLLGVLWVQAYIQVLIHFELFFCRVYESDPVWFFCLCLSSFSRTVYSKGHPSLLVYCWLLCHKLNDHICLCLFLGSLFLPIDRCVYWSLALQFKITENDASSFAVLSQDGFAYLGSFEDLYKL